MLKNTLKGIFVLLVPFVGFAWNMPFYGGKSYPLTYLENLPKQKLSVEEKKELL